MGLKPVPMMPLFGQAENPKINPPIIEPYHEQFGPLTLCFGVPVYIWLFIFVILLGAIIVEWP